LTRLFCRSAILCLLTSLISPAVRGEEGYYFLRYSWVVSYGAGENELGIEALKETPRLGPCAFSVNAGKIYILDAVNSAVKVFSREKGRVESAIAVEGVYDDLMVNGQGELFLLDPGTPRLLKIGQSQDKSFSTLPPKIALQPGVLGRIGPDVAVRIEGRETYDPKTGEHSAGIRSRQGLILKVQYLDSNAGAVDIFDSYSRQARSIVLRRPQLASIDFLAEDERGCLYLQLEYILSETRVGLEVAKLNKEGETVAVLPIPENDYFVWTSRLLFVDEAGWIYQVLPQRERVKVNVWAPGEGQE